MTTQQAKEILAVYRPGTEDELDPLFAEALALIRSDASLRKWFEESMSLDRELRAALGRVAAPANLRDTILTQRKIIRPAHWWQRRLTGREMAAAAVIFFALTLAGFWVAQRPARFADFRREIADQSWGPTPHLEVKTSDLSQMRQYLSTRNISTNFALPPTLAHSELRGCSVMHWRGRQIPVLCFNSEGKHLHLMVAERSLFPDAPSNIPETDQWQAWRTASWSMNAHTYVLTGLSTPGFVKKFRKAKRWDWEG
jgi:hypothetical protein